MADPQYIPAGGWRIAGLSDDGTVWAEPIIAWEFTDGIGRPVVAEPDSLTVFAEPLGDGWLVAPGDNPETSRNRPTADPHNTPATKAATNPRQEN